MALQNGKMYSNSINRLRQLTIKQAAWDKINNSLDVFGLKQPLINWYNSLFEDSTGEQETEKNTES